MCYFPLKVEVAVDSGIHEGADTTHEHAGFLAGPTLISAMAFGLVFITGISAAGNDLYDTCLAAGQELDTNYRLQNSHEASQFFPLHNKCNALYDTVPAWINPVLAFLALLTVGFLLAMASTLSVRVKSRL